ncbi:alpha-galactosidase [Nitzschia inconspicua]|uniref:Alpha-galactosidase n=1 Tax=Nitzschia inconspicua TaxID=303405 RepID=A0A9K3PJU6_9STRA|nr:alpha-galactosidase [Nitzschia inconspicua]
MFLSLFISFLQGVQSLDNGLARTPPMGWLSWERFGCQTNCDRFPDTCISESFYLTQAELMVDLGLREAGYVYVNIDDCWAEKERDPNSGKLMADKKRFPHGIKHLSDTFHSMGMKLGLYGDIGSATCEGYPGFEGTFDLDAGTLAEWEVDSIKVDACNADEDLFNTTYPQFGRALNASGRSILYSCSWPNDYYERRHHWEIPDYLNHGIKQTCNIWRNYFDIHDSWDSITKTIDFWARNSSMDVMVRAAGPGHFNDPDMLVIGNPGLSLSEQQTQFSLWAIFSAPLFISADLRTIPPESLTILLNKEIIAVNQDALGRQGWCAEEKPLWRIWVRELTPTKSAFSGDDPPPPGSSDRWAVVLENRQSIFNARIMTFNPTRHLPTKAFNWNHFSVRDLVEGKDLGLYTNTFSILVDESSSATFLIRREDLISFPELSDNR